VIRNPSIDFAVAQKEYLDAILRGSRDAAAQVVLDALGEGADLRDIYLQVLQPGQRQLGTLWHENIIDVGTEHLATAVTQSVMSLLYPRLFNTSRIGRRLVGACLPGELHELGVRMVCDFFEFEGWDTYYLGSNVPAASIADTVFSRHAEVLALSATVGQDVELIRNIIREVRAKPGGVGVRVLVGGLALSSPELCREVGADGFAPDARTAVVLAHELLGIPLGACKRDAPTPPEPTSLPLGGATPIPGESYADDPGRENAVWPLSALYSEHINSQRELAKLRVDLARLAHEKNELIGILAHDLRNPLSVVLSYSRLLRDPELSKAECAQLLDDVESSTRFVLRLVEETLELAMIERGQLALSLQRVDVSELIAAAARLERVLAQKKKIVIECRPSGPCMVDGDPAKLRQVFTNLLSNAVKYSHPGSEVMVSVRQEAAYAVIEVRDHGVGIEPEDLKKLFQPFSRLRKGGTQGERSTGLGLAIVRRIVEGHAGGITVESQPGSGSRF
jgi:methanogenic corrinoid protein MtbC1/two-component sensor histidine kinase